MATKTVLIDSAIKDAKEREEALTPDRSYIVQAPAGSGKTGLLVQRILRLLSVASRPESVVAMTFTIKAAGEMRERVVQALQEVADDTPLKDEFAWRTRQLALRALERDRESGWGLLTDPGRLQIQTIDALCAMLVRQMPIVSESGGFGNVVEDPGELYQLSARRTLQTMAETDDANRALFRRVVSHFDNDMARLERQIVSMLSKRDQWCIEHFLNSESLVGDFCRLLHQAREELKRIFREENEVDFSEITRAAIHALGDTESPSDLLYSLDYRIEHLLVDEFQDTSQAQYQLLDALTGQWSEGDGRTLFLVGDPMQSIYRFRAADVGLFLQAWETEQLGSVRLQPLRLQVNFRSTPEIVDWTCSTLASVMGENNAAQGAVQFAACAAARPEGGVEPQMIPLLEDKSGEGEAREIVRIIRESSDLKGIAILVRNRSHVLSVLPALREAGIPYQAIEIDQLQQQQHILDLLSLTRAVSHRADRTAWLACLRAPWCGLALSDLAALAESEPERTILNLLSDPEAIGRLSPDGRMRAVRVQEVLSAAVRQAGRMPLRELVEQTWLALGGPAVLGEVNQQEDADIFFGLLEKFEEGGAIRDFGLLTERLQRLYAKPSTAECCVQVMTVHQAKGLEFDTVILPQLARWPRADQQELLICNQTFDEEDGTPQLHIAPMPRRDEKNEDYERIREALKEKNKNEAKRLFYVACTRAKNRLFLLGSANTKQGGKAISEARDGTFLRMIWDRYKSDFESLLSQRVPPVKGTSSEAVDEKVLGISHLHRLPTGWELPDLERSIDWQPGLRWEPASARRVRYDWVTASSRHVGAVVHQVLKRAAGQTHTAPFRQIIRSELRRLGVPAAEETEATEQAERALEQMLVSEKGRWIFGPHTDAKSEWSLSGEIGGRLISGTIDRSFRDEEGRLWIIDFKVNEHRGVGLQEFLDNEERRYRPRMEDYATLVSRMKDGPIWLGLYFPLLHAWREWEFAEEKALASH